MKIAYISHTCFADIDFSILRELKKKVELYYFLIITLDSLKTTAINIQKQYPVSGIFKLDIYPEIKQFSDFIDIEKAHIVNVCYRKTDLRLLFVFKLKNGIITNQKLNTNMKTLLFIHNNPLNEAYGGSRVTERAYTALSEKYIVEKYFVGKKSNKLLTLIKNIFLYSGSLSPFDIQNIFKYIQGNNIDIIFFDVSLHGRLVKRIKVKYPEIKLIVNFHNNESKFYFDLVKSSGLLYLPIWLSARYNEKLSLKYSDLNIFITENDKMSFGNIKTPSIIIPATLPDNYKQTDIRYIEKSSPYILFVGAAFYANLEGAYFLIKKIAPYVSCNVFIVGKGMKTALSKEKLPKNVNVEDYVEDLSEIYNSASAFVAPLFLGSGMKVKLAEAMMYGKKIIATSLAFYGYKIDEHCFSVCDTAEDFIKEINSTAMSKYFYEESRKLFLDNYSSLNNHIYYSQIDNFIK